MIVLYISLSLTEIEVKGLKCRKDDDISCCFGAWPQPNDRALYIRLRRLYKPKRHTLLIYTMCNWSIINTSFPLKSK